MLCFLLFFFFFFFFSGVTLIVRAGRACHKAIRGKLGLHRVRVREGAGIIVLGCLQECRVAGQVGQVAWAGSERAVRQKGRRGTGGAAAAAA